MENGQNTSSENPQTGQNPVAQPVVARQSRINIFPLVVTAVTCALLFGFGGYYLAQKSGDMNQVLSNPTPTYSIQPTTVPTVVELTTDWDTYTSSEYLFKYPKNLKSDTGAAGTGFESIRVQFVGPKQIASGRTETSLFDGYSFIVTKTGSVTEKTSKDWATERRNNSTENCGPEVKFTEIQEIIVDGKKGFQYSGNCMVDYTSTYVSNGNNVYEITQSYVGEEAEKVAYKEITQQIFNTLKFL